FARIAEHGVERTFCTAANGWCRGGQERAGYSCRYVVEQIVKPRRSPAECAIALAPMTDHAVCRIHGLVGENARQSCKEVPERRRDNPIGKILRRGFDRRAADTRPIKGFGIAADDSRYGHPCRR